MKTHNNTIINVDTDAILICKPDQSVWTKDVQKAFLDELNAQFPEKIKFDHDGIYDAVLVAGSKNYALLSEGATKVKLKGSAFRDQKKEPALREMINKIIDAFMFEKRDQIPLIYASYVAEIMTLSDISRWSKKITVTEAVLRCEGHETLTDAQLTSKGIRANESNVWDAIKDEELIQSGDKAYIFSAIMGQRIETKTYKNGKTKDKVITDYGLLQSKFWDGNNHDKEHLLQRLYNTLEIFDAVLDISQFKNFALVKNYKTLTNPQT